MNSDLLVTWLLISILSVAVVFTGYKRSPGIGIIIALALIGLDAWLGQENAAWIGLNPPDDWGVILSTSLLLGILLALASTLVIEPLTDRITKSVHDHSVFEGIRGNLLPFLLLVVAVWVLVAFIEELIFRGYLMTELMRAFGGTRLAGFLSLILSSTLFGLAHWYQGRSGVLSTTILGSILGLLFLYSGYNLWLPILTHGFIDTVGLGLIYLNLDIRIKRKA